MNSTLIATLGGIGSLILWGLSDWFIGKSSQKHSTSYVNMTVQVSASIIVILILLLSSTVLPDIRQLSIAILASIFFTLAYLCFIKAFSNGQAGIVAPLANSYPLVTLLLSAVFLSLSLSLIQYLAIIVIVLGGALLGTEKINLRKAKTRLSSEVSYALLTALFWGLAFFTMNSLVDELPWETVLGMEAILMAIFSIIYFILKQGSQSLNVHKHSFVNNKFGVFGGLALTLGSIIFYATSETTGNLVIPAVIASASPLVTSLLANKIDGEKLLYSKRVGAILVVIGIVILNI